MTVGIVTDSAADLPQSLVERLGIAVVPLEVRLPGHPPEETSGISAEAFWELQRATPDLATTAAPSPGQFAAAFESLLAAGHAAVCCITISADLSATSQAAAAGAELAGSGSCRVVDSRTVTMGQGNVVLEAAVAAAEGAEIDDVVACATDAIGRSKVLGTLDTLENLRRGGRIGSAQALLGSILSIKPVVEVRDGVVEGESKQRTRSRSLQYVADKVKASGTPARLAVVHAAATDVGVVVDLLEPIAPADGIVVTAIGPVVGAHTGLGTVGVCWLEPPRR